jgi:hypothetical protein
MGSRIRDHLTYANVVSTLCLFVLLGGGAYAATKLGKDSVGSKQVKNGSLKSADLQDGGIEGTDVGDDALEGPQIDESSLGAVPDAAHATAADNAGQLDGIEASELGRSFGARVDSSGAGPIFYVKELDALLLGDTGHGADACIRIRHTGDFGTISVSDLADETGPKFTVDALHTSPDSCADGPLVLTNDVHPDQMLIFGCAKAAVRAYCYGQLMDSPAVSVAPLRNAAR